MAEFPAMPLWVDAYLMDTHHLDDAEHGAYLMILMALWTSRDGWLEHDPELMRKIAHAPPRRWKSTWPKIQPFFIIKEGRLSQNRVLDERLAVSVKRNQRSRAGDASAKARALKRHNRGSTSVDPPLQRNANETSTLPYPTPTPTPQEQGNKKTDAPRQPSVGSPKKGVRCPDTLLTDELNKAANQRRQKHGLGALTPSQFEYRWEMFKGYWQNVPGAKGLKLDWRRAWLNDCIDPITEKKFPPTASSAPPFSSRFME